MAAGRLEQRQRQRQGVRGRGRRNGQRLFSWRCRRRGAAPDEEVPAGLAIAADGRRLFVCGNLSNRLLELDAATGRVVRQFEVGVAPFDVVLVGKRPTYRTGAGGGRARAT